VTDRAPKRRRVAGPDPGALHAALVRLLRLLRRADRATGVSAARLSALSVVVFGGPLSLTALAEAEQVALPSASRLVAELEKDGYVERRADAADARALRIRATAKGRRRMLQGRRARLAALDAALARLGAAERKRLDGAIPALETLARQLATAEAGPAARSRPIRRPLTTQGRRAV
jgi:DNA-binding MarR family transcriptional regulator